MNLRTRPHFFSAEFSLLVILAGITSAAAAGYYTEFQDWLVQSGYEHIMPPQQRTALVDAGHEDTWRGLDLDADDFARLKGGAGRGVFATVDLAPGDVIFTTNFNAAVMLDPDADPPPYPEAPTEACLACLLLREKAKGNESRFAPYLNILPEHVPIPWIDLDPEEFSVQLQFELAVELATTLKQEPQEWHSLIDPALCANATIAQLEWASSMINTRIYYVPINSVDEMLNATQLVEEGGEVEYMYLFLPFADMVNMQPGVSHIDWEQRVFKDRIEFVAVSPIRKGQEIVDEYPSRSATDFAVQMGFLPPDEPFNSIPLFSSIEDLVVWYVERFDRCQEASEDKAEACYDRLVTLARSAAATSYGTDGWDDAEEDPLPDPALTLGESAGRGLATIFAALHASVDHSGSGEPSDRSRAHGLVAVRKRCEDLLAEFPTTIEEDEVILGEMDVGSLMKGTQEELASGLDCQNTHTCPWKEDGKRESLKLVVRFRLNLKRRLKALVFDIISQPGGGNDEP